jgi:sulfate adenylyltransferase subunit 1
MPIQYVIRPRSAEHPDYRGYAGRVASGVVHVGDDVVVLPAGLRTRVIGIDRAVTPGQPGRPDEHDVAFAPQSVVVRLADQLDVSRGDLIASADDRPRVVREIVGTVAILSERPLRARDRVLVRVGTRNVRGLVSELVDELDVASLERGPAREALSLNAIGRVRVRLAEPVALDDYADLRQTGAFLLVDEADGTTLAAGMAELEPEPTVVPGEAEF